jgi:hypothetical protein
MAMESAFRPKCFASKTKQRFSGLFEMQLPQLLLMNGTILEIQTYLFNPSDAAQNPKMISDRILKTFTLIQEV